MKSSTRLESAVFQLTPTRTRCDLLVSANGKTEKVASGLLSPFLAHLKTAQDQVDKGGYSIVLKPEAGDDAGWFTKGTIERFVRFVSTPEVLERVYTIESEILQIKEAIAIQSNNDMGLAVVEEKHQAKTAESNGGSRPLLEPRDEKAIVLYQPGSQTSQSKGSSVPEENSKVQVLKVLETRKTALQREQGMAFARAVAAGFGIDDVVPLISFAKSFGASRLMDACVKFIDLWKKKHETGQWVEIEATEAMSAQLDIYAMNESGIMLANSVNKQRDSLPGTPENNGKASLDAKADAMSPMDNKPNGHQEYLQGQFPQPIYPPWPVHSPPGAFPVFQGYPMQGMPYYASYPGNKLYQSPYPSSEDPRYGSSQRKGRKHHPSDSEDTESEDGEKEKVKSGGRKKSGKVVIRNINYITSEKQNSLESDSGADSDADSESKGIKRGHSHDKGRATEATEADNGHWQAFQNYLLKDADREESAIDYEMEKDVRPKRRQSAGADDPLVYDERGTGQCQEGNITDMQNGHLTSRLRGSNDELFISRRSSQSGDGILHGKMDVQFTVVDGKRVFCRRTGDDGFMIHKTENHSGFRNTSDPLSLNGFENSSKDLDRRNMNDDSYILSLRSVSLDEVGSNDRSAIDIGSEIPLHQAVEDKLKRRINYEPDDLSLVPERGTEKISTGFDPAMDYELQARASLNKKNEVAQGAKKSDKDPKSKLSSIASDKKKVSGPIRKGRATKLSPLDEARARAEKLRNFKADLQKMKKEKEEEEKKRIEALKRARQKRIAARSNSVVSNSVVAQSTPSSQQTRKKLPAKLSPGTHRGSKFTDSDPGSSSPLKIFPIRTASLGSNDSHTLSKTSKLNTRNTSAGNRLTRSVSSIPEPKKQSSVTPETKSSIYRTRKLSEPKMSGSAPVSSMRSHGPVATKKVSDGNESKKISAIVNHDKSKTSSLPELKIKTPKGPVGAMAKASVKDVQKTHENKSSKSETELNCDREKVSHQGDGDESPVFEKTVVMLECGKPSIPAAQGSVVNIRSDQMPFENHNTGKKPEIVSEYAAIHAPVSLLTREEADKDSAEQQFQENPNTNDIVLVRLENLSDLVTETPKFPTSIAGNPYQAPYARLSSLEDSCTRNSDYGQSPATSVQIHTMEPETDKAFVYDSEGAKLEKIPEASGKSQTKESSKGLRKLLKFGRKTHSSDAGEHSVDSDNVAVGGSDGNKSAINTAMQSEVYTLKNLISQDETPTATAAPHKSSRHFSLLSPFKSKPGEKKVTS